MYRLKVLDYLSLAGRAFFEERAYEIVDEYPEVITTRSSLVNTDEYPWLIAVARRGAGVNNITCANAAACGVAVFNTPGANANAVAELVCGMMIMTARNVERALPWVNFLEARDSASPDALTAEVEQKKKSFNGFELSGKTLGVVGLGAIGRRVAECARSLDMRVIGYDPYRSSESLPDVETVRHLSHLLSSADLLTLHVPLSSETRGMIGESELALLPPGAIILNYARGAIVDEEAVCRYVGAHPDNKYVCDFPTPRLIGAGRSVVLTPHIGACTEEAEENCSTMAGVDLDDYLRWGLVRNCVTLPRMNQYPMPGTVERLCVIHHNARGVLADITGLCSEAGYNLKGTLCPTNEHYGYAVMDLEESVTNGLFEDIANVKNVIRVRRIQVRS